MGVQYEKGFTNFIGNNHFMWSISRNDVFKI